MAMKPTPHADKATVQFQLEAIRLYSHQLIQELRQLHSAFTIESPHVERTQIDHAIREARYKLAVSGECALYYLTRFEQTGATMGELYQLLGSSRRPVASDTNFASLVYQHRVEPGDAPLHTAIGAYMGRVHSLCDHSHIVDYQGTAFNEPALN